MELSKKYKTLLDKNCIDTPLRLSHFFAQIEHESGLKPISENLNYSASGLKRVFRRYFTDLETIKYQRKPEMIANRVYANRMENGDEKSGDGWKYRGRGFLQITGKSNYTLLSRETGIDYLSKPELLLNEADAMISALWYWNSNNINRYADLDDLDSVSDLINIGRRTSRVGDANGYKHREELLNKYKKLFGLK